MQQGPVGVACCLRCVCCALQRPQTEPHVGRKQQLESVSSTVLVKATPRPVCCSPRSSLVKLLTLLLTSHISNICAFVCLQFYSRSFHRIDQHPQASLHRAGRICSDMTSATMQLQQSRLLQPSRLQPLLIRVPSHIISSCRSPSRSASCQVLQSQQQGFNSSSRQAISLAKLDRKDSIVCQAAADAAGRMLVPCIICNCVLLLLPPAVTCNQLRSAATLSCCTRAHFSLS